MEGELDDRAFYAELIRCVRAVARPFRHPKAQFSDCTILEVFLWAVYRERPVGWACRNGNWDPDQRWWDKPSPPTMSRRLGSILLGLLMAAVLWALRQRQPRSLVRSIDAKPLGVGGYSKDRAARWGWGGGAKVRGYQLFLLRDGWAIDAWGLGPMNAHQPQMARRLLEQDPRPGYLLGDCQFDSNPLHAWCTPQQIQVVAPPKKADRELGHHPQTPGRLRSRELLAGAFGRDLYRLRADHERYQGRWVCWGGGLTALPAWVRTPKRVARWVGAKLIIFGLYLDLKTHFHHPWQNLDLPS